MLRAVTLLALRLGRRSVVDRLTKWREQAEKEEFPFPRNENFVGRKKELSELEFMLFGDVSRDAEKDYFDLKAIPRRKILTIGWGRNNSVDERRKGRQSENSKRKGKEPVVWKESEKEIEMQSNFFPQTQQHMPKLKSNAKHGRRRRSMKVIYRKGIACVSGDWGIGKTELLLEFAYRFHQRYKMVLWIGGESRYIRQNYLNLWPFVTPVDKWLDKSLCWQPIQTNAQLNPCLWQELALSRATVLEIRSKLMMRGGQFDIGDDLIRKALFIRTSICGDDHPDTISARETLTKLTRLLANVQSHISP